jgi:hypothetical protein
MQEQEIVNKIKLYVDEIRNTGHQMLFVKLLNTHIDKIRIENDSAGAADIMGNQGTIRFLHRLVATLSVIKKEG